MAVKRDTQQQILECLTQSRKLHEKQADILDGILYTLKRMPGGDVEQDEPQPKPRKKPTTPAVVIRNLVDQYGWPQVMEAVAEVMGTNDEEAEEDEG
jgi:hypothetical protein